MTDVIKIAMERRSKLQDEIAKLDEFVRMAEALVRQQQGTSAQSPAPAPAPVLASAPSEPAASATPAAAAPAAEKSGTKDVPRPSIIRRGLAAS